MNSDLANCRKVLVSAENIANSLLGSLQTRDEALAVAIHTRRLIDRIDFIAKQKVAGKSVGED